MKKCIMIKSFNGHTGLADYEEKDIEDGSGIIVLFNNEAIIDASNLAHYQKEDILCILNEPCSSILALLYFIINSVLMSNSVNISPDIIIKGLEGIK